MIRIPTTTRGNENAPFDLYRKERIKQKESKEGKKNLSEIIFLDGRGGRGLTALAQRDEKGGKVERAFGWKERFRWKVLAGGSGRRGIGWLAGRPPARCRRCAAEGRI